MNISEQLPFIITQKRPYNISAVSFYFIAYQLRVWMEYIWSLKLLFRMHGACFSTKMVCRKILIRNYIIRRCWLFRIFSCIDFLICLGQSRNTRDRHVDGLRVAGHRVRYYLLLASTIILSFKGNSDIHILLGMGRPSDMRHSARYQNQYPARYTALVE